MLSKQNYSEDNTLYIPNFENINNLYNINNIYTPRKFSNTNEYIIHLENLRKLKNYVNITKHLDLLNNSVYKNIIKDKLIKINWPNKIEVKKKEEKKKLIEKINNLKQIKENNLENHTNKDKINTRCKSSLDNYTNKTNKDKINTRCKSSLNYKNLKKVNIKKSDVNDVRNNLKLDKLKLPKI